MKIKGKKVFDGNRDDIRDYVEFYCPITGISTAD